MLSKIRILLFDDDPLVRTSLRLLLNTTSDLELLSVTADVTQLLRLCAETNPHILLIGGIHLTASEQRVLRLLIRGFDNHTIAVELNLAEQTIRKPFECEKSIYYFTKAYNRGIAAIYTSGCH